MYQDLDKGPKVMEGTQTGTLYKLSITLVPPSSSSSNAFAVTTNNDADITLWHNMMGHVNIQTLKNMSIHKSSQDFTLPSHVQRPNVCKCCAMRKQHKATYPSNSSKECPAVPSEILHADLCGKMSQFSLGGASYYILIKDDCTSYRFIAFLKVKSDALCFFLKSYDILRGLQLHM